MSMKSHKSEGEICLDGPCGLVYDIGLITYVVFEDESFRYEFLPNWPVIDLLDSPEFQGVPGFDLDARKSVYVRENITPTFITERAPVENREGLWQLLEEVGMDYLDKVEWLVRTNTRYIGDGLYVRRAKQKAGDVEKTRADAPIEVNNAITSAQNSMSAELALLKELCAGRRVAVAGEELGSEARRALHVALRALLEKSQAYREDKRVEGVKAAAKRGTYAGRKRKGLDPLVLAETFDMYETGALNAAAAAKRLGISQATFFRRLKEHRAQKSEE